MTRAPDPTRRASVVVIVLWAIALATIVASAVQLTAYRQAVQGREVLARTQARWAARAGLEDTIAVLADHTFDPVPDDAFAMILDMENVALGEVEGASYEILHHVEGRDFPGPMDEHSRYNIHQAGQRGQVFETFRDMRIDIPASIGDWLDEDDEPTTLGVEREYYQSLANPYEPRNGPMHNIAELELVAGVWPEYVRGEDWNLNNRLDPEENDGMHSLPDDEPDGILETGWAARLTTHSVADGATASGLPRIHLKYASVDELTDRLPLTEEEAQTLIQVGGSSGVQLEQLYTRPLSSMASGSTGTQPVDADQESGSNPRQPSATPQAQQQARQQSQTDAAMQARLDPALVDAILRETSVAPPYERNPGKMNINTVEARFLRELFVDQEEIADEIIYLRQSRPQGIVNLSELQDLPEMTDEMMSQVVAMFTTTSNVFTVTSRGRAHGSGLEVEMIVVVDRSTLPVRILEYREQ